ncbi:MAG: hypothetical protein R3182_01150, partial [Draconibacterium sp.]|nr:hypothetical protein [Draconibacterium sp.]
EEYCSAFGKASVEIKNYLSFWESYHEKVAYNIPAGGKLSQNPNGLYETICSREWGSSLHPLKGHWQTQPFIYNDSIMSDAKKILDKALKVAEDKTVIKRIDFLQDGLIMVEKSAAYMEAFNNKNEVLKKIKAKALIEFNDEMRKKHGYWNSKDVFFLKYWGLMGEEMDSSEM